MKEKPLPSSSSRSLTRADRGPRSTSRSCAACAQCQEVELVGILERLLSEVGCSGRQRTREVRQRLAMSGVCLCIDLHGQGRGGSSRARAYGFGIPEPRGRILDR